MTRPVRPFTRPALAALFAVGFLGALVSLSSCSPEEPEAFSTEQRTRAVAAATWDQQEDPERESLCEGIVIFGVGWAVDQISYGLSGAAAELDPEMAVQYIIERCGAENLWPVWAADTPLPE